jgi:hypothetical protein
MTEYSNVNRGSIWKNAKKNPESDDYKETLPDFTGSLDVEGRQYWVSAWKRKEGAAAKAPALSFTVKPKDEQPSISQRATATIRRPDPNNITSGLPHNDMDDSIPFAPEFR